MYITLGSTAVAAYLIGFFVSKFFAKRQIKTVRDVYEAQGKNPATIAFKNACAVKLANEIRESGALRIKQIEPDKYEVTLKVVK